MKGHYGLKINVVPLFGGWFMIAILPAQICRFFLFWWIVKTIAFFVTKPWSLPFFILTVFGPIAVRGQQPYFNHFTVDDGLPSNELYQVLQEPSGNLLIATDRGAVRYDGYSFTDISINDLGSSKPVYYIYQSPDNKIFFSGLQGKVYQHRNDSLFETAYNGKTSKLFKHPGILIANAISIKNDTTWISFNNDYNYNYKVGSCFVTPNGAVEKINDSNGIYFDIPHRFFYRQLGISGKDSTKQPVFITWPGGQVTYDEVELNWQGGYIRRLFLQPCGGYLLFSIGRELFVYRGQKKISRYRFPENVLAITSQDDGRFFVGFENIGVGVFRFTDGKVSGPEEQFLNGYSVTYIQRDSQGGTWFSTLENGLFYQHPSKGVLWPSDNKIVSIIHRQDRVFVAQNSGLIQVFLNGQPKESLQVPLLPGTSLLRLAFTGADALLAITTKGYYHFQKHKWTHYKGSDILLLPDGAGQFYGAAAAAAELNLYKKLGDEPIKTISLSKRIISLFVDRTGGVWVGTWEGLLKYENGTLTDFAKKHPFFNDRIVAIGELEGKQLVVATLGNGLAVLKNNKIFRLNAASGFRSAVINNMEIDGEDIWLGTNKGLVRVGFHQNRFKVVYLGLEAGLPSLDVHQFSVTQDKLYVKWVNKMVVLNKNNLLPENKNSRTRILAVLVNDKSGSYQSDGSLNHHENALTFNFTQVNLSAARQQQYAYLLEGFDKSWHHTNERYVRYTNLPPGNYRFLVQAINLQDSSISMPATYSFTITPAFWQRWWFPFLVVNLVVILLAFFFQRRLNAIKEKNNLLLELAENRQKVLVQMIHPHFVFNVLNTIQGAVLKQEKMVAASLVARFAKLMRLSMELSKEKWVKLEKELAFLKKYFELEAIRSPGMFEGKIEISPPVQPSRIRVPSMLIQPFVENAIKHGIMHLAGKQGLIRIQLRLEQDGLLCLIDDNGIGREQAGIINQNQGREHQSSGIEITINRLRLLHREQGSVFQYNVFDKKDALGQPEGTRVVFFIPFKYTNETDESGHRG